MYIGHCWYCQYLLLVPLVRKNLQIMIGTIITLHKELWKEVV